MGDDDVIYRAVRYAAFESTYRLADAFRWTQAETERFQNACHVWLNRSSRKEGE